MTGSARDAAYFDAWYADMAAFPARDAIVARTLGLPADLQSTSLLGWQGLAEVTASLPLDPAGWLVDVACGRGGYGIEVAQRTGARLLGIDFSAVALGQAATAASRLLPEWRWAFVAAAMTATGLVNGAVEALMCLDSVQFAEPPPAALAEFRRVLAPGGRVALTCWEPVDPADDRVLPRLRAVNLRRDLPAAGFVDVQVQDMGAWHEQERAFWTEVVGSPAGTDPALRSLQAEGRRSLETLDRVRRVFATGSAPG